MKLKKFTTNFISKDLETSISYYRDILGFKLEMVVDDNHIITKEMDQDKNYVYALMSKDDLEIMFQTPDSIAEDIPACKDIPKGISACFYLEVEGLTDFYQEIHKKVEIVRDLYTTWYGMQEFHIKDCNGNILGFAKKAE
ncbi:VOC family protein [Chengkuizengella sp. SCS-71B]|uniref:VOC family protein n=1 Tax=Chengkuizengella sp. SCS-71B TaxID=3115290 RepID=UPI0032C21EF7